MRPFKRSLSKKQSQSTSAGPCFVKLQKFCKVARDGGQRCAWSDTCCIDQNNNVEVQQSVNFMFVSYHHSAFTIVYLSDVPPSSEPGALASST
ncbi:uncharacterized protein HD556DRAFT_1360082 [Suillus plorans]|uniref:Heterokaryon incompatibility domain-containing protein n=1 Tax=Suillus plorans TaxID=116603 RepID=A0A9P7DJB9_9AGAM|nr:uncharacterized protein HD556DRAFT_1360082 [Suillus plorans]KAG1796233.1 hypothetical protein HD556DRAFT_1360082 [Suillus plorans]